MHFSYTTAASMQQSRVHMYTHATVHVRDTCSGVVIVIASGQNHEAQFECAIMFVVAIFFLRIVFLSISCMQGKILAKSFV